MTAPSTKPFARRSVATGRRLAGWSSVTSVPYTPRSIAGCAITPRPRNCARTCSSRRCERSASSKTLAALAVGCAPIAGRMAINRSLRRRPAVALNVWCLKRPASKRKTPLLALLVRERNEQVHQGLRRLRTLDRQTLTAFYVDGSSLSEMSRQFASPVGTIKRRLHVARKRLARELEALGMRKGWAGVESGKRKAESGCSSATSSFAFRFPFLPPRKKAAVASLGGKASDGTGRAVALFYVGRVFADGQIGYGCGGTPSFSSSSSWMMMRGVTIIIRLWASRPMPTFLNSRLR